MEEAWEEEIECRIHKMDAGLAKGRHFTRMCCEISTGDLKDDIDMPIVTLPAHFDGRQIVLDEAYDLPANANLMVTVLPSSSDIDSEESWLRAAASSDAFAFLADPAEDIYTLADGEPVRDAV